MNVVLQTVYCENLNYISLSPNSFEKPGRRRLRLCEFITRIFRRQIELIIQDTKHCVSTIET